MISWGEMAAGKLFLASIIAPRIGHRLLSQPPPFYYSNSYTNDNVRASPPLRARGWLIRNMSRDTDPAEVGEKIPSRLVETQRFLDANSASVDDADAPIPRVSLEHVSLSFARSGGAGGQNVNKVNTKVDMRFDVLAADWLPDRVRLKLLEMEKNRINGEGELVVSSSRTRTQKANIDDALEKIQEMINAAAYVPPPPSEATKKKIQKLARRDNEKRLQSKKRSSTKKADRRNKGSWD